MNVLFVCLGNICRSPMAEYLCAKLASEQGIKINSSSAGTSGWHDGEFMHAKTAEILKQLGCEISAFKSRKVTKSMINEADLICVMDDSNYQNIKDSFNDVEPKMIQLGRFIGQDEIADPWYTNDFGATKKDLIKAINKLLKEKL